MPKKTNQKALAARAAKENTKNEKNAKAAKAAEDSHWADDGQDKKSKKAAEAQRKQAEALAKKKAKQELEAADKAELEKGKKKAKAATPKVTQAMIAKRKEAQREEAEKQRKADEQKSKRIVSQPSLVPNLNKPSNDDEYQDMWVSSVDQALKTMALDGVEKPASLKAAYKAYAAENMPQIKDNFPGLKLSQYKEKLWNQWQKAPENPLNQK